MKKIFLRSYDTTSEYGEIHFIHYMPFDTNMTCGLGMSEAQLNEIGKVVEVSDTCNTEEEVFSEIFNVPAIVNNTRLIAKINSTTHELSYEYVAIPTPLKTAEQQVADLQAQMQIMQDAMNAVLGL